MMIMGCVRVSIAVERHCEHSNSYKGRHLIDVAAYSSEVQSMIIMVRPGCVQADMVLER